MSSSAKSSRRFSSSSSSSRRTTRRMSALASRRSRQGKRRGSSSSSAEVSEKLETLRNLIPACGGNRVGDEASAPATERLFQETADYILRLRAQVVVLQRLVQLYGSDSPCAVL